MNAAQLDALEAAAVAAKGRKEMRCQVAMADIYKAAALLPQDLVIPEGNRDWSRSQGRSLIEEWLASSPYFARVDREGVENEPGDLLVFRLGHVPHHVAILLPRGRLAHVFGNHGVQIAPCIPTQWATRIHSSWSPVISRSENLADTPGGEHAATGRIVS